MTLSSRLSKAIIRWRYLGLLLSLIVLAIAAPGLGKIGFDSDARVFFDETNPDRIALDQFEAAFAKDDNIGLVVVPEDGAVFTPETLAAIADLTDRAWHLPYVRRVDSLTNFQLTSAEADNLTVTDLVQQPDRLTLAEAARVKAIALSDERLLGSLIPVAADVTVVQVLFRLPGLDLARETPEIVAETAALAAAFEAEHPDLDLRLTGSVMMNQQFALSGQQDGQTLTPAMLLAMLVVVALFFRSVSGTLAAVFVLAFSAITALGALGHLGGALTSMSVIAPLIIMTLALASVGHVLAGVQKAMKRHKSRKVWVYLALRKTLMPMMIAGLTTVVGFLSLNFSISPPFRQLGNIVAFGMVASLVYTVFLLPALLCLLPQRRRLSAPGAMRIVSWISTLVQARPQAVFLASAALIGLSMTGLQRLVFEDDFVRYFDERYELRRDMDFYETRLGGHNALEFALPAHAKDGISDPDFLADVASFTTWLRAQPEVTYVRSLTDTLSRLNMHMHGDDKAYRALPDNTAETAQYLFLYELSLPYGVDLTDQINVDRSAIRVTATMAHATTTDIRNLTTRAQEWMTQNAPQITTTPTGLSYVFSRISERDVQAMLKGSVVALVGISVLLFIIFRDIRVGMISLVPNLVPAAVAFGIWGYTAGSVTLAIAVVLAMTLGIVVDDTVHFLSNYQAARLRQKDPRAAVSDAFEQSGTAILVTSVGFILGFLILGQSGFAVNGDMARLTALTIGAALLADLFLLPSLLIILQKEYTPMSVKSALVTGTVMIAAVFFSLALPANADSEKGLEIAQKADALDAGWQDYYAKGQMVMKDASGNKTVRDLESFNLERDSRQEGDWLIIVFSSPADISGTASLTHSKLEPANDDQWLFLPANKRVKRISSSNRAGKFVSSEFSFEDLSSQEVADYTYNYVGTEPCPGGSGLSCFVVESTPRSGKSGYSKRTLWIDTQAYRQFQVQYFNRRGELEKVLNSSGFQKYAGKHWRPNTIVMKNVQTGKSTELLFSDYTFRMGMTAAQFSAQNFQNLGG